MLSRGTALVLGASLVTMAGAACIAALAGEPRSLTAADCPQPRFTGKAPADFYGLNNPLVIDAQAVAAGERAYRGKSGSISCASCHGEKGDGKGVLASQFDPPPRNFACAATINGIPDGQLFWIIKNGSPGTAMPPASSMGNFSDPDIWRLVAYLRRLAR